VRGRVDKHAESNHRLHHIQHIAVTSRVEISAAIASFCFLPRFHLGDAQGNEDHAEERQYLWAESVRRRRGWGQRRSLNREGGRLVAHCAAPKILAILVVVVGSQLQSIFALTQRERWKRTKVQLRKSNK
jgi:hypothetical protein